MAYNSVAGQGDAVIEASAGMSNPSTGASRTITASLTFNGVAQPNVYFTLSNVMQSNATVHLADQVDASALATGRYPYSLTITSPDMTAPATVNVVNGSVSPVGDMPGVGRLS